ncbi:MAG: hypothetical protein FWG33_01880 [Oscillospiraceae bacterium]|nr:hypothetical protein [Oscillospiraceae bacterium]
MDMESMAKLLQVFMASNGNNSEASDPQPGADPSSVGGSDETDEKASEGTNENSGDGGFDFSSFFENIDFNMISKMGELFSHMNKPDMNAELLSALKPHLRIENQHKIDSAMKLSRMMSMLPFLKESGILNDLF